MHAYVAKEIAGGYVIIMTLFQAHTYAAKCLIFQPVYVLLI